MGVGRELEDSLVHHVVCVSGQGRTPVVFWFLVTVLSGHDPVAMLYPMVRLTHESFARGLVKWR